MSGDTRQHARPAFLLIREVAELLRMSPKAVYSMIERGQLPGLARIGRRLRAERDVLLDWLRQKYTPRQRGEQRA